MEATEETRKHWASLLARGGTASQGVLGGWLGLAAQVMASMSPNAFQPGSLVDPTTPDAIGKTTTDPLTSMVDWRGLFAPLMSMWTGSMQVGPGATWPSFTPPTENPIERMLGHPALSTGDANSASRLSILASTAMFDLMQTSAAHQALQAQGWITAMQRFAAEFNRDAGDGPPVVIESLDDLLKHWTTVGEATLQEHQRSDRFLQSQAEMLRKSMQLRIAQRKVVEAAARARDLPTLSDLDEAFSSIHDLRNEVRELRRELRSSQASATPREAKAPAQAALPAARPPRMPKVAATRAAEPAKRAPPPSQTSSIVATAAKSSTATRGRRRTA